MIVRRVASSDSWPSALNPPPPSPAVFPDTLTSASVTCASPSSTMPPPFASALAGIGNGSGLGSLGGSSVSLPEIRVPVIVTRLRRPIAFESPALKIPPPACASLAVMTPSVTVSVPPAEKIPPPSASVRLWWTFVLSTMRMPWPAFEIPAPFWWAKLSSMVESTISIVPTTSNSAWLTIAGESGSYTPGAGTSGGGSVSGSSGSGTYSGSTIIWPGLSEMSLRSIRTVPEPELFTAAPPPPEALPDSSESVISRRPPGRSIGRQTGQV